MTTCGLVILSSGTCFAYYGIMMWMPSYLETSLGFSLTKSALWTASIVAGMAVGIWTFGQLADRIGRKPVFIAFQIGAAIMVYLYSRVTDPHTLLWMGAVMGLFVNGKIGGIGALMSEAYPTAARATAQNVLFNLGRAVGGLGPLVVGVLTTHYSFPTAIALLASIYVLEILATVFLIPELKGKELE
jgi:MFS family permease